MIKSKVQKFSNIPMRSSTPGVGVEVGVELDIWSDEHLGVNCGFLTDFMSKQPVVYITGSLRKGD